jgi:hypothetical protein
MIEIKTDRDLAPMYRTEANYWRAEYFRSCQEVVKLNRACSRLSWRCKRLIGKKKAADAMLSELYRRRMEIKK